MELLDLPDDALKGLRARGVSSEAHLPIRLFVTCLDEICQMVAEDCGPDRYDSNQSEGQLRYWRTRTRVVKEVRREHPELAGLRAVETDNSLQLRHGECLVSFYAARDGVDSPRLSMGSKTQRHLVDQMQLQLEGTGNGTRVARLAVLYEADGRGLLEVAVGVLGSPRDWNWRVVVFRRPESESGSRGTGEATTPGPSYDEQPVPDLPAITPKRRADVEDSPG